MCKKTELNKAKSKAKLIRRYIEKIIDFPQNGFIRTCNVSLLVRNKSNVEYLNRIRIYK